MSDNITIPQTFEEILKRAPALHESTWSTLRNFHPWIRKSGTPFFPEYTDHGVQHISEVLATASSLITNEARRLLTPEDVAVLVLATLLHDAGMHLTKDGFRNLVDPSVQHRRIEHFDDQSWQQLWLCFLGEASRFDSRKLKGLFGDAESADPRRINICNLTESDLILVGEFVRRHHTRLAHEMALWGVPGPSSKRIAFAAELEGHIADLSGVVARSHGLPLRATYKYLDAKKYDRRQCGGVHTIFLMAVLRIADYIQVHKERAETELLLVKRLRSPISQREWGVHAAIREVRMTHQDPEALFIEALPEDVQTYNRLAWLMKDIQAELDQSWAALGEVYGRSKELKGLGLTIRRILSSLDDPNEFATKVNYVPAAIAFESAGTHLLRLLVGPLYGDDPGIGIRELIQNATDACQELADWKKYHGLTSSSSEQRAFDTDVVVELEEEANGSRWVTVRDAGIGMTLDVIRNYFLRAGASMRHSEAWRRAHEDESGRSRVLRTGRFGVGALAGFLIGDKLHVTTRHVSEPPERALEFVGSLDTDTLDIRYARNKQVPVGTTIRIPVNDEHVWTKLLKPSLSKKNNWESVDWYFVRSPSVLVRIKRASQVSVLEPRLALPGAHEKLPTGWHRTKDKRYADIHWSYHHGPKVACNGIVITETEAGAASYYLLSDADSSLFLRRPNISVFDTQGVFPLNLQRNAVAGDSLPFDKALTASVTEDFLAFVLARMPEVHPWDDGFTESLKRLMSYPGLGWSTFSSADSEGGYKWPRFLFTRSGLTSFDKGPIMALGLRRIWVLSMGEKYPRALFEFLPQDAAIAFFGDKDVLYWVRRALRNKLQKSAGARSLNILHSRFLIGEKHNKELQKTEKLRMLLHRKSRIELKLGKHLLLGIGAGSKHEPEELQGVLDTLLQERGLSFCEWTLGPTPWKEDKATPLSDAWMKLFPSPVIPFHKPTRHRDLRNAYSHLEASIEHQRRILEEFGDNDDEYA